MSSMVTSTVRSVITMLQVEIGLLVQKKRFIERLYKYRVSASNDEVKMSSFKMSSIETRKTLKHNNGLI